MFPKSQIQSAVVKFSLRGAEGGAPDAEDPEVLALLARLAHADEPKKTTPTRADGER